MIVILWKESYRIGVAYIDLQHKELFDRVTDFLQAIKEDTEWDNKIPRIKETIDYMEFYITEHFKDEEAYQLAIHYDQYEEHYKHHEVFKADIARMRERLESSDYSEDVAHVFGGKLITWLIDHVTMEDQRIGDFVHSKGSHDEGTAD